MAPFTKASLANLEGVHPRLVDLITRVTQSFDCSILGGTRTIEQQKQNVADGLSETLNSKHLVQADGYGHAIDVAPTPQEWHSLASSYSVYDVECVAFLFYAKGYAKALGLDITIGADWNNNNLIQDNSFRDLDHIELTHDNEPANPLADR